MNIHGYAQTNYGLPEIQATRKPKQSNNQLLIKR